MTEITRDALQDALVDVDYPAAKDELVDHATRNDAPEDVRRALRAMPPEVDYGSFDDVLASVHATVEDRP